MRGRGGTGMNGMRAALECESGLSAEALAKEGAFALDASHRKERR